MRPPAGPCFASGGAAVALAAHAAGSEYLTFANGGPLSRAVLRDLAERFARSPREERAAQLGIDPRHADLVPAGFALLEAALERLGAREVVPTTRGVAEGLLAERLAGGTAPAPIS